MNKHVTKIYKIYGNITKNRTEKNLEVTLKAYIPIK